MSDFKVFIITEVRVYRVNSHIYADSSFAKILERYHKSFNRIVLATRIIEEDKSRNGYVPIDDYCYCFNSIGSIGRFLTKKVSPEIVKHVKESNLVIMRLPSLVSLKINRLVKKYSKKYMTEVMGCAWDAYWNHGIVGKVIAPFMFLKIRGIVKQANYCIYVTQTFLQKRYPNHNKTIGLSNVDIKSVEEPKDYSHFDDKNITIMTAAALDVKYKGQQYVIKAISEFESKYDVNIKYYLAGKGDDSFLKKIAKQYNVEEDVIILGMLSREELSDYMRKVDFYIQPSLQEGLPRSLIEAMSHGCVCIGSDVAGIPELLDSSHIFKRKSVDSLIGVLSKTIKTSKLSDTSKRNIQESKKYLSSVLDKKRFDFYGQMIKDEERLA